MQVKQLPPSVLITGAQSGLGKATAELFTALGSRVFPIDKNNCDITDFKKLDDFISALPEIPRVWINCAGVIHAKKILKLSSEEFKDIITINLVGNFNIIKIAVEKLSQLDVNLDANKDGERGVIINTASIAAFEGQIGQVAYSASKAGVVGMTLPLARELAPLGIRVMTISPGVMDTPMVEKISEKIKQELISSVVFPKRLGHPEEFARMALHIVENSYLNGSVIRLDGALRMAAV